VSDPGFGDGIAIAKIIALSRMHAAGFQCPSRVQERRNRNSTPRTYADEVRLSDTARECGSVADWPLLQGPRPAHEAGVSAMQTVCRCPGRSANP